MENTGKLVKKIFIEGKIIAITGLHIGGSDIGLAVGSTDNVIIRCAMKQNQPYIPGSSLKGKMRSLFEKTNDCKFTFQSKQIENGPCLDPASDSAKLFGVSAEKGGIPSRLIVRDGYLLNPGELEKAKTDMPYSEIKTETVIDRITSAANPRQIERVPAGAEFELKLILNVFKEDKNEKKDLDNIFKSLILVQDDYLGGYGSRGSGQVEFKIEKLTYKDRETYEKNEPAKSYKYEIPSLIKDARETNTK
ncbi:MAG: type III-A CRISPR-associated RAMP protein Csm3 [Candidatus Omnitrophota bacterium]